MKMENYKSRFVSALVLGYVGVFFYTNQRTNRPTNQSI